MSSHGRSGGALIRPQHKNLISNKNHNCNAKGVSAKSGPTPRAVARRVNLPPLLLEGLLDRGGAPPGWSSTRRCASQSLARDDTQQLDTAAGGLSFPHLRAFPVETGRLLASFFFSGAL